MSVRGQRGFTLVELLIVLVVMAVLVSITSLSFRSFEPDPVELALERLRLDVAVLSSEAIIRSEPLALGFTETGYHFFKLDDKNKWIELEKDNLFKAHELEKVLKPQVLIDQEAINLSADLPEEPQVIVEPTGELTPFTYELVAGKDSLPQRVQFDAFGQVVKPVKDDEN